jgi:hypothetical protein
VNNVGARFAEAAAHHAPVRLLEVVPLADAVTLPACPLPRQKTRQPPRHNLASRHASRWPANAPGRTPKHAVS